MKKRILFLIAAALLLLMSGCRTISISVQLQPQNDSDVETDAAAQTQTADSAQAALPADAADLTEAAQDAALPDSAAQTQEASDAEQEEAFTNLHLELSEGTINLRSGTSFSLTRRNGPEADYEITDDTLYVKINRQDEVTLVLPDSVGYGSFTLTIQNGHAYAEGPLTFDDLSLQVTQGEASLEDISVLNTSNIQINGGSASIYGDPGASVTADCRQGHLNLSVPFQESDYDYEITVSGGNIHLGSHNYNGRSASKTISNNGERSMDLSCTHGDLSVEFGQ